jgi:hypothetical protein
MLQPAAALSARWNPLAPPLAVLLALLLSAFELKILAKGMGFCHRAQDENGSILFFHNILEGDLLRILSIKFREEEEEENHLAGPKKLCQVANS